MPVKGSFSGEDKSSKLYTSPMPVEEEDALGTSDNPLRRMTAGSRKWSSSGLGLTAAEAEARRLEKKGTFHATVDEEADVSYIGDANAAVAMCNLSCLPIDCDCFQR